MSRSFRKSPFRGLASNSDKWYKKFLHKRERRKAKISLKSGRFDINYQIFSYSDWDAPKDGKTDFRDLKKTDLKYFRKLLRK